MKVYIAGPMSGHPDHNVAAFSFVKKELEEKGHEVVTPFEFHEGVVPPEEPGNVYAVSEEVALFDLESVVRNDAVYMLRGWELSRGARAEHAVATWLGKHIWYE
jgi:nucleoside 2-deoxyribosyltransferase